MKKIYILFLIAAMLLMPAGAKEMSTREMLCLRLSAAFGLEEDSQFPLLRYKDWAKIDSANRSQVAAVIKNGLFTPEEALLFPDKAIDDTDLNLAVKGIKRYIASKENLHFYQGTVQQTDDEKIVLHTGLLAFTARRDTLYLEKGLNAFSALKIAQKVDFAADAEGRVLIGWDPKRTGSDALILKTGRLYLYDRMENGLILKNTSDYRDGMWKEVPNGRYEKLSLDNNAYLVCEGRRLRKEELNQRYLDRQVMILLNQQTRKIVFAMIQS